jgi:biotin carboxylase
VNPRPILLVGYSLAWQEVMAGATDPVVFVEEPDVARKRDVDEHLAGSDARLVRWEYQLAGAADSFYLAHRDLDPIAILPGVEYAVPFAARLAERYGVRGAGLGAASILSDKALLRTVTREAGIPNPRSEHVSGPDEVHAFMAACDGPIVLKPANRQASVGTQVIRDADAIDLAWHECTQQDEGIYAPDRDKPLVMLAEQFVAGDEFSVELLVRDGEPLFANVTEKHLFEGPRPIELGHAVPAPIPPALTGLLVMQTSGVLDAVGFGSGFVHCEWIVMDGVPYLVECAGRMPGDLIVPMIDNAWQTDMVAAFATVMRGELPDPLPEVAPAGSGVCFIAADPGEVVSVSGVQAARELDGVISADVLVKPGSRVNELRSSWDRVGWVYATAATADEALELARRAAALITVDVLTDALAPDPVENPR